MPKNALSRIAEAVPSKKEDRCLNLFLEYKKGSQKSYVELVLVLIKCVAKPIARKMWPISRDLSFDDLIQESYFGIARAIEKYDPQKGSLRAYAYFWAKSFMKRAIDEKSGDVQQKCGTHEDRRRIIRLYGNMCAKDGEADWDTVSELTKFSISRIENLKKSQINYVFLDAPIKKLEDGGGELLNNFIAEEDPDEKDQLSEISQEDLREKVLKVMGSLRPREEKVLRLRFGIRQ